VPQTQRIVNWPVGNQYPKLLFMLHMLRELDIEYITHLMHIHFSQNV